MDNKLLKCVRKVMGADTVISHVGSPADCDCCIIFIPGNPGIIEFYDVFLLELYEQTNCRIPVVGIAQAGHSPTWEYTTTEDENEYFSIADQINHKMEYIRSEIPSKTKLILIGHSVGVYIILKLLEDKNISQRLLHAVNLFPAIEDLKNTPNGRFWMPVSKYCRLPFAMTAFALSFTPMWFKNILVAWRAKGRPVDDKILKPCHSCVSFSLINHALYMAATEMDDLNELDENIVSVIHQHENKLTFYYGSADKWAPLSFNERMKDRFPRVDVRLCDCGYPHDFVLDSSKQVAKLCFNILQEKLRLTSHVSTNKNMFFMKKDEMNST